MSENNNGVSASVKRYAKYLMVMAGLGGLLYGIDVGVIAAALPYIQNTSTYTPQQLSGVVAAVLLGSVLSSLFAGMLAEWMGRKKVIVLSAFLFTLSIPIICFSNNVFWMLMAGRILQGASAGLVGVVVPMYLAECLDADSRGKGTGMFQLLLTVGLVFAAVVGLVVTMVVGAADSVVVTDASKMAAWQTIFWCSAVPGLILFFGAFRLCESPRWLYRLGRKEEALKSLAANNGEAKAKEILAEMIAADEAESKAKEAAKSAKKDSLLQRKYVIPFILAVVVLACTQATGINSVLNYSVKVLQQAGLAGETANWADLAIKLVNMIMTIVAVSLVDKKGRTFLLKVGTIGIIAGLVGVGSMFLTIEKSRIDVTESVAALVSDKAYIATSVDEVASKLIAEHPELAENGKLRDGVQLIVTYKQGDVSNQIVAEYFDRNAIKEKIAKLAIGEGAGIMPFVIDDAMPGKHDVLAEQAEFKKSLAEANTVVKKGEKTLSEKIETGDIKVPAENKDEIVRLLQQLEKGSDRVVLSPAFAMNPSITDKICFWSTPAEPGSLKEITITRAEVGMKPGYVTGWIVTLFFIIFISFYAAGPGVCVWLALSELMPNRIRANGMAIALLINQGVSTTIAGTFLPWVGASGYSTVFFCLGAFTIIYFITAAFFMPETKGRTLEEIEQYFTTGKMPEKK